jgi:hypothetical protein
VGASRSGSHSRSRAQSRATLPCPSRVQRSVASKGAGGIGPFAALAQHDTIPRMIALAPVRSGAKSRVAGSPFYQPTSSLAAITPVGRGRGNGGHTRACGISGERRGGA